MTTALQLLDATRNARELLRRNGIARHKFHDDCGRYCVLGALKSVSQYVDYPDIAYDLACMISGPGARSSMDVARFNDTHTDDEIFAMLDSVITVLELTIYGVRNLQDAQ